MEELSIRYIISFIFGIVLIYIFVKTFKLKEKLLTKNRLLRIFSTFLLLIALGVGLVWWFEIMFAVNEALYEIVAGVAIGMHVGFSVQIGLPKSVKRETMQEITQKPVEGSNISTLDYSAVEITDSLKEKIIEIYNRKCAELPEEFYAFDDIPPKKFENAKKVMPHH